MRNKLIVLWIAVSLMSVAARAQTKLMVGIVVDQMRYDYLARFSSHFCDSGFQKLLSNGRSWEQMHYNYLPTFTGPGHASIYTGTTPAIHGIAANDWFDITTNKNVYCVEDKTVQPLGEKSADPMSPANLRVNTIGDQLKAANPQSKVFGVALKDRGGILPAGKMANGVYWYDSKSGCMISSSYYSSALPDWVVNFNKHHHAQEYLKENWNLFLSEEKYINAPDNLPYEKAFKGESLPVFPHDVQAIKGKGFGILRNLPFGNTYTTDFALALTEAENLGRGNATDMLCISYSSPDYIGHQFGTQSREVMDAYIRLDREIARLLHHLDKKIGAGNYVVFLSSDHGAADHPYHLKDSCFYNISNIVKKLKTGLMTEFGDSMILTEANDQLYIKADAVKKSNLTYTELAEKISSILSDESSFMGAVVPGEKDCDLAGYACNHSLNGRDHERSGQIWLHFRPGCLPEMFRKGGTTHGTCYHYDTHVPFIISGPGIEKGSVQKPAEITDIAPTVCQLLGIAHPSGCTGKALPLK